MGKFMGFSGIIVKMAGFSKSGTSCSSIRRSCYSHGRCGALTWTMMMLLYFVFPWRAFGATRESAI